MQGLKVPRRRKFPKHTLQATLVIAQKIADEMPSGSMDRLLLADALGMGAGSSTYRDLLSSSRTYGLTEGTEKAKDIKLLRLGKEATAEGSKAVAAKRKATLTPETFNAFYKAYDRNRLPSDDLFPKILTNQFGISEDQAKDCVRMLVDNGKFTGIVREISGSPTVMLDAPDTPVEAPDAAEREGDDETQADEVPEGAASDGTSEVEVEHEGPPDVEEAAGARTPKHIFIGHGRKKGPLEKLERILTGFQVPYKVAVAEPNLGRPIPNKVKETMNECGSAILIFTKDEKFFDADGNEVWRPSENVVHELGAASFAYEDRIVIFKEEGLTLASNFSSIGYIEFLEDAIESKTAELLQELIGFGLLKLTPAG